MERSTIYTTKDESSNQPVALITGAAVRLGRSMAEAFHNRGCRLALHYNQSEKPVKALQQELQQSNPNMRTIAIQGSLDEKENQQKLIDITLEQFGRIDILVNNASIFFPEGKIESDNPELFTNAHSFWHTNFLAPLNLAKLAAPHLKKTNGCIINLIDIYADAGLIEHPFYVASKSALKESTKQLAHELAPKIRVNGISPGAMLWPEQNIQEYISEEESEKRKQIIKNTALKKLGGADSIAATAEFLAFDASYMTGQVINVDGGRRWYI